MFVPMTAHCPVPSHKCASANDYLRSLSRVTVPRLFTYASNDELSAIAAFSVQS